MTTVRIVQIGPLDEGLDLGRVAKRANKAQEQYEFALGDVVNVTTEPDEGDSQYSFEALAERLYVRREDGTQLLVGVTDLHIFDELFSAVDEQLSCVIISTADIQDVIDGDRTTPGGYVLFEIAAQLLTIEYRRMAKWTCPPTTCGKPWHNTRQACIFDYDEERQHTGKKMLKPRLCPECKAILWKAGVASSIEAAALKIAGTGVTPIRTFVRRVLLHRWFTVSAAFAAGKLSLVWGAVVLTILIISVLVSERRG